MASKTWAGMSKFERATYEAQRTADREGRPMGVYNLNPVGSALYVVRDYARRTGSALVVCYPQPNLEPLPDLEA